MAEFGFGELAEAADFAGGPSADLGALTTTPSWNFGDIAASIGRGARTALQPIADVGKAILPAVQAGTGIMGAIGNVRAGQQLAQQTKTGQRAERLQEETARKTAEAAAPLTQFGTEQLQLAEAGKLPPAIQARIDQWVQGAKQQVKDYAARSGQGDSAMLTEWLAWIEQQGQAMAAAALQEQQQLGIQGLQAGAGALAGAGAQAGGVTQTVGQESAALAGLMSQANEALSRLSAGAA